MICAEIVKCHVGWGVEVDVTWSSLEDPFLVFPMCEVRISYESKCVVEVSFVVVSVAVEDMFVS